MCISEGCGHGKQDGCEEQNREEKINLLWTVSAPCSHPPFYSAARLYPPAIPE